MHEAFENLPDDKKKKIITEAIQEFAQNGYEGTSTNAIVKRAGISKGILFHYFGSKKNLYLYVIDYTISYMTDQYYAAKKNLPDDFFEKLILWSIKKMELMRQEPFMFKLLMSAYIHIPEELTEELNERWKQIKEQKLPQFVNEIDTTKFRKDIEPGKAVELIIFTLDALGNKYLNQFKEKKELQPADMNPIIEEYKAYIDILKGGIYP